MKHCMIDSETHDTTPAARILSVGAVMFDPRGAELGAEFYATCTIESQADRTYSQSTLDWWAKQSPEAKAALTRVEPQALVQVLLDFKKWFQSSGAKYPWSHGVGFDIAILENAFENRAPWKFWNTRDTRTMFWLADNHNIQRPPGTHHDALEDAKAQALAVQHCWRKLRGDEAPFDWAGDG